MDKRALGFNVSRCAESAKASLLMANKAAIGVCASWSSHGTSEQLVSSDKDVLNTTHPCTINDPKKHMKKSNIN
eukprot:2733066-Amphidinium_carterae.1